MADEHEHFEKGDAGASHTFPSQAGTLKKGGYIVIKGHPCKVFPIIFLYFLRFFLNYFVFTVNSFEKDC